MCPESGFPMAANWSEIEKNTTTSQFADTSTSSSIFFDIVAFLLSSLVTRPSFRVMTIFLYKGLTKNPEIGNIPV